MRSGEAAVSGLVSSPPALQETKELLWISENEKNIPYILRSGPRIKIIKRLSRGKALSVSYLAKICGVPKSTLVYHLKKLKDFKLLADHWTGFDGDYFHYYKLSSEYPRWRSMVLEVFFEMYVAED